MQRLGAILAGFLLAGCGGLSIFGETGLACQHPPREVPNQDNRDPFAPGEPFADLDPTTMTADEVAKTANDAGLEVTFRFSYGIGEPGTETSGGYAECWCVPPPGGRVSDLGFDSGGRLIIFVDSGETLPQARAQPRMGWGCAESTSRTTYGGGPRHQGS